MDYVPEVLVVGRQIGRYQNKGLAIDASQPDKLHDFVVRGKIEIFSDAGGGGRDDSDQNRGVGAQAFVLHLIIEALKDDKEILFDLVRQDFCSLALFSGDIPLGDQLAQRLAHSRTRYIKNLTQRGFGGESSCFPTASMYSNNNSLS